MRPRPCPACVVGANPYTGRLGSAVGPLAYLAALADAKELGLDKVIGDLCWSHRAEFGKAERTIHDAVAAVKARRADA